MTSPFDSANSASASYKEPLLRHSVSAPASLQPVVLEESVEEIPENHLVHYDFDKPTLKQYILHEHTITSLYYGESHLVTIGCCCIKISKLRFRKRVFLFAWSILFVLLLSLEVQFGLSNWFYQWMIIIFAMPIVIYILKILLARFDDQENQIHILIEMTIYTIAFGWTTYLIIKLAIVIRLFFSKNKN